MGGPFSDNLRRYQRRRSTGGAGADHAEETLMNIRQRLATWRNDPLKYWPQIGLTLAGIVVLVIVAAGLTR